VSPNRPPDTRPCCLVTSRESIEHWGATVGNNHELEADEHAMSRHSVGLRNEGEFGGLGFQRHRTEIGTLADAWPSGSNSAIRTLSTNWGSAMASITQTLLDLGASVEQARAVFKFGG
jgi:hypothetical protein